MLYGRKQSIDHMLMDLQSQKFRFPMHSPDGKKTETIWVQGSLRILPGGIYDYVFTKEDMDLVLTTLNFHLKEKPYDLDKKIMGISPFKILKDFLKIEDIPKFKTDKTLIWYKDGVSIIPIGIRHDKDLTEQNNEQYRGWTHEAI